MPIALEVFLQNASPALKQGIMEWIKHSSNEDVVVGIAEAIDPTTGEHGGIEDERNL